MKTPSTRSRLLGYSSLLAALLFALLAAARLQAVSDFVFTKHSIDTTFDFPATIDLADMDGDGDLDILGAAYLGDDVSWWENTAGDGAVWSEYVVADNFDGAHSAVAADIDGDGDLDVVGAADTADDVTWWENVNGDGLTWSARTIDGEQDQVKFVVAADVEGDGDLDVVASIYGPDDVLWYDNTAGDGSGWIKRTIDDNFLDPFSLAAADVDGDGDTDVLGTALAGDQVAWWENVNGDGLTWTIHTVSSFFDNAWHVEAVDLDADGDLDILGAALYADDVTWWENENGDGLTWTEHTIDGAFDGAYSVYAADVDDDGDLDVLGGAYYADDLTWWENLTGSGEAWSEHLITDTFDGPRWIEAADLDGDSDTDVVAIAENGDEIAWWEKTTAWIAHTIDGNFDGAYTIATADVDGDGHLDVLGAGTDADSIAWWQNSSGDGFIWTRNVVAGDFGGAAGVAAGDLDGDGDTDVVGAAYQDDTVAWWENDGGQGTNWHEHVIAGFFDGAHAVATADVDADGDLDVLGASRLGDEVTWWENDLGDGSVWTEHLIASAFEGAYTVTTADVNQDGYLDAVGVAYDDRNVTWWENELGDGSLWRGHLVTGNLTGVTSVAIADLDRDTDLDILTTGEKVDAVVWWENSDSNGTSWRQNLISSVVDGASSAAISDVDSDGDPDILATANLANTLSIWKNSFGDGTFWFIEDVASAFTGARSLLTADVDGDGDQDLLAVANGLNTITWWEQERAPWKAHLVQANFPGATAVTAADVNSDKNVDIVAVGEAANGVAWWQNLLGDGVLWQTNRVEGAFKGARAVVTADMDADGFLDIVAAADREDTISWWANKDGDGLTWSENVVDASVDGAVAVDAADLDADGDLDVLGAARWADTIAWWQNADGLGTSWTKVTIDAAFDGAVSGRAADVDADGDLDVVGAANSGDEVAWWQNVDGSGLIWLKYTVAAGFNGAQSVAVGDLDGDGRLDIVAAARWVNQITWYQNVTGDGVIWNSVVLSDDFTGAYAVNTADVDSDGDLDVLGAATDADTVAWIENRNGDGSLWTERAIGVRFDGARGVSAGDFDGDTDLDIVGAASGSGTLAWWENTADLPPNFTLTATPSSANVCAPTSASYAITLDAITGFSQPVDLSASGYPPGSTVTFTPTPVTPPGSSAMTVGDTAVASAGSYTLTITGLSPTRTHTTTVGLNLYQAAPIAPTLIEPANGSVNQPLQPTFSWSGDLALTYDLDVAVDSGFNDIVYAVTSLTETSHTPTLVLDEDSVYYWRVRATNTCGTGSYSPVYVFTTEPPVGVCPAGTTPTALFSDGFETGAGGWTHSGAGDTWILSTERPYTGSFAYYATDVADVTDQLLVSPEVTLPAADQGPLTLQFWNYQAIEHRPQGGCFDGAILEISTDGGATYDQLVDELQTDPYDGLIYSSSGNPLGGLAGWCGDVQDWKQSIVDLDAYAEQAVKFRFRLGTDTSNSREGWYLDDLVVQSCVPTDADFTVEVTPPSQSVCAPTTLTYDVVVTSIRGFQTPVMLTSSGEPPGATSTFSYNPVTPPGVSLLTLSNLDLAPAGHYTLDIQGTAATLTRTGTADLDIYTASPTAPVLLTPLNGAIDQPQQPVFTWSPADQATSYSIDIATDSGFTDIVESAAGLTATSFVPTRPLEFSTTYYWRVRAVNTCGAGSYSAVYSFTTQLYPPGSLVVDSTADAVDQNPGDGFCRTAGGECTLRAAVQEGNASSDETTTIVLPAGAYLLTIPGANEDAAATGDLDVTGNLLILGDSAPLAVIDGNGTVTGDRVFHVLAGGEATISGVTIRGGRANDGGGLYNSGTATLTAVTLTANTSTGTLFAGGGAIINKGTLLVTDSAIHNNTSGDRGAAIYNTPSTAQATVINSTLSSNAAGYGGALFDDGATLTLTGSTITLNTASHDGGGAYLQAGGTLRTGQTIWAGNSGGAPNCRTVTGSLLSDGYNILGNNSGCSFTSTTGDQIGTPSNPIDPRLGPLGDNGGPTFTHALSSGSPAIDTGDPTNCLPFDQRGEPRPQDGDGNGSAICDIGAYEAGPGQASLFCSSPNLAIPDNNPAGVNDYLTLSETGSITDLDVYLLASHTWVGDLLFTLEHVATGTTITLIDRPGAPPAPSCDGDDIDATLDDEAATLVEEACAPTTPTIFGSFIPYNSLSAFDGEDLSGGWRLTAADLSSGDTGTLTQWCLVVER